MSTGRSLDVLNISASKPVSTVSRKPESDILILTHCIHAVDGESRRLECWGKARDADLTSRLSSASFFFPHHTTIIPIICSVM